MKILLIGNKGQLGTCIENITKEKSMQNIFYADLPEFDISDENCVKEFLFQIQPELIINCAAYTNVDKAEIEKEKAQLVNVDGVKWIGTYSAQINTKVIHISTDYVYDGTSNKPITEKETTNPLSVYGNSKLQGELMLFATNPNSLIIRTSWLYSHFGNNFVKTMLNLGKQKDTIKVVSDQIGTPTYARDLAATIIKIAQKSETDPKSFVPGIYHYSNEGVCSWYDFAVMIFKMAQINCGVVPIFTKDFPTPAVRPKFSLLDKTLIKEQFDVIIPHWVHSLEDFFRN
ncbi:MAG: dTDP-4-dehydrorhamnose reductase [Marinilabiliaceae bacterium]|nr:dTDP-4-dehydrorhamnose reductase [Marinilabiliaceae bacterium]